MLMLDPAAAFRETRRVLRSGGRLAFSVWGAPEHNPFVTVPGGLAVELGLLAAVDPRAPGGMFSLADPDRLSGILSEAGFGSVELVDHPVPWKVESFYDLWRFYTELAGAVAQLIASLPRDGVESYRDALRKRVETYRVGEGYELPGLALSGLAR
jgi:SAM-dependent methyltransferase